MDPNNNPAGVPDMQNQPVDSVQPVAPTGAETIEQALVEANMEVASGVPMGAPVKKSGKGAILGMIVFAILAIAGIGFGVWAMMDGNAQKANLEKQISDLRTQNNQLLEQIAEGSDDNCGNNGGETSAVDSEDYIYVGEWGLKIKKPENWRDNVREYSFYNGYPQATDTLEIRESSEKGAGVMIGVGGESCDTQAAAQHNTCFVVDGKAVIVTELVGELVDSNSSTVSEGFLNHFYNSENYSAI